MLKIGKMSDYATVLLAEMAGISQAVSAANLSARTQLPVPTVAKLLKQLSKAQLVTSLRGAAGGYTLARSPESITVADVLGALEGPLSLTECAQGGSGCNRQHFCGTKRHWHHINQAVIAALKAVTLADLARPISSAGNFKSVVVIEART
jgi:FeS assembly SUF system regulator